MVEKARVERFLRALVGLMLLSWLVVAFFVPPDPFTFLLWLVPGWLLAGVGAYLLVYRDGYERLRASSLYDPGLPASKATTLFVVLVVALKAALTSGANLAFGSRAVDHEVGVLMSAFALLVGYLLVYWGIIGWVLRWET